MTNTTGIHTPVKTEAGGRIHIFILIDALGWEYIKERPFLNDVLPHRQPLRTVLGFSSGAIPTILTGVPFTDSTRPRFRRHRYDPLA